jgi:hypothetical protein
MAAKRKNRKASGRRNEDSERRRALEFIVVLKG